MCEELFLAMIVSIDTYLAAAAYCNSGIRIPVFSALMINAVGAAVLGITTGFSETIGNRLPANVFRICGRALLTTIGVLTIMKSLIRNIAKRLSENGAINLKTEKGSLVVRLYLNDTAADTDNSKVLSMPEAFTLALASSLDSAATGLGSGCGSISPVKVSVITFFWGTFMVILGNLTGRKIASLDRDLSWIGGILLIAFAFLG